MLSIMLVTIFTMQLLGTNIIASNIDDNVVTLDPKNENIVVKYSDGSEEIISPDFDVTMRTTSVNERQYAPYIPDGLDVEVEFAQSASNSTRMATPQGRIPNNLQIVDATVYPYTTIGYITSDLGAGSAFLVGPDIVVTAAHCVFDTSSDTWGTNIKVYFGVNDTTRLYNATASATYSSISIQQSYVDLGSYDVQYDWAIIRIDQPLGYSQGYLGFHGCSAQENYKSDMILSGYPNDINYSSTKQEKSIGSFYTVNANSMRYRIFCVSGMSGGPIFDTQYSVYAIHSYATSSSLYNGGGYMFGDYLFNMIADAVTDSIERWN